MRSQDWTKDKSPNYAVDGAAIQNALNSSDPATALNPFVRGSPGPDSLLRPFFGDGRINFLGRGDALDGLLRGPILKVPAGEVELAVGGDYNREKIYQRTIADPYSGPFVRTFGRRSTFAVLVSGRPPSM